MPHLPVVGSLDQWEKSLQHGSESTDRGVPVVPDGEDGWENSCAGASNCALTSNLLDCFWPTANLNYGHDYSLAASVFNAERNGPSACKPGERGIDVVIGLIGSVVTLLLTPLILTCESEDRGPLFYRSLISVRTRTCYY